MRAEWVIADRYWNAGLCHRLVEKTLAMPAREAQIGLDRKADDTVRRSKLRFVTKEMADKDALWRIMFDDLWRLAMWANDEYFDFRITRLSSVQIAEYDAKDKGEYKRHHDVFWFGNGDTRYHRKLSVVIQLSDPVTYTGGGFQFYDLFKDYPDQGRMRQQGSAIIFPSFTYHAAMPVLSGTRYSVAAWFEGPKWA